MHRKLSRTGLVVVLAVTTITATIATATIALAIQNQGRPEASAPAPAASPTPTPLKSIESCESSKLQAALRTKSTGKASTCEYLVTKDNKVVATTTITIRYESASKFKSTTTKAAQNYCAAQKTPHPTATALIRKETQRFAPAKAHYIYPCDGGNFVGLNINGHTILVQVTGIPGDDAETLALAAPYLQTAATFALAKSTK